MSSVTPRERREVAKSLRYLADLPGGPLENDEQFTAVLKYWIFVDFKRYSYDETLTRLADLIDPTYELKIQDGHACCGNCGHILAGEYESEEDYWCFRPYCPDCGARAVRRNG